MAIITALRAETVFTLTLIHKAILIHAVKYNTTVTLIVPQLHFKPMLFLIIPAFLSFIHINDKTVTDHLVKPVHNAQP